MDSANPIELIKAAFHDNNAALVRDLLAQHPELKSKVNAPLFPFDAPAINFARSREMLDVLLDAGADINAKSQWWAGGFGILHGADPALAAYAIERGAIVDVHAAARLGLFDRLRELIAADPSLVHARGGDGQTPLHFASTTEIAGFLLDRGADIDARDIDHESTPAQWMLRDRQPIAKYLVEHGAKTDLLMTAALGDLERVQKHLDADPACIRMNVSQRYFPKQNPRSGGAIYIWTLGANKTAHQIARDFKHEEIYRLLIDRSPVQLKLAQACEIGDESAAAALLASHPNLIQSLTADDHRSLVNAVQNNNVAAVRHMLAIGFPVDAKGQHGGTALHWAAFHGNVEMTREILRHSPPLDVIDDDNRATPLGWATYGSEHGWFCKTGEYAAVAELLCQAGAVVPKEIVGTPAVKEALQRFQKTTQSST